MKKNKKIMIYLKTQLEEFDQCGLEDDGIEWTEWDGPKRIKETRATNEEQIKYRKILDRCFSPIAVMGVRVRPFT